MGHCDSPAQLSRDGEIFRAGGGTAEIDPPRGVARRAAGEHARIAPALRHRSGQVGSWLLLWVLRVYQVFLSPFFGGACKFYPSCSNYAYQAIARHGARRGFVLAFGRLLRCRPFSKGGFDPVPDEVQTTGPRPEVPGAPDRFAEDTLAPLHAGKKGEKEPSE
jgi:putative membrane protein insertion efficiency factor